MELSGHDKTPEELYAYFKVDDSGLSDSQVESNRKKYGPNGKLKHAFRHKLGFFTILIYFCQCSKYAEVD